MAGLCSLAQALGAVFAALGVAGATQYAVNLESIIVRLARGWAAHHGRTKRSDSAIQSGSFKR